MKKALLLLLAAIMLICTVACGGGEGDNDVGLRPIDYPGTSWKCKDFDFEFSVSDKGEVIDGHVVDKTGASVAITISFTVIEEGKFSVANKETGDIYFLGDGSYGSKKCTLTITDVYNDRFDNVPKKVVFVKS